MWSTRHRSSLRATRTESPTLAQVRPPVARFIATTVAVAPEVVTSRIFSCMMANTRFIARSSSPGDASVASLQIPLSNSEAHSVAAWFPPCPSATSDMCTGTSPRTTSSTAYLSSPFFLALRHSCDTRRGGVAITSLGASLRGDTKKSPDFHDVCARPRLYSPRLRQIITETTPPPSTAIFPGKKRNLLDTCLLRLRRSTARRAHRWGNQLGHAVRDPGTRTHRQTDRRTRTSACL